MNASRKFIVQAVVRVILCAAFAAFLFHVASFAQAQTRPSAASTQLTEVRTHPPDISFLQLLLKGGWFMVPIGIASMIGLALILERYVALRRGNIIPRRF